MSLSTAELEAKNRDELLEMIVELSERVDDHQRKLADHAAERAKDRKRIHRLEERTDEQAERIEELEASNAALRDIGTTKTSKEEKIAAIISYADNIRDADQSEVAVAAQEIKGAAGVTRRYAYDLIDDVAAEYPWATIRDARTQPSSKDGGRMIQWKKALAVDFEQLHADPEGVNKFTTEVTA